MAGLLNRLVRAVLWLGLLPGLAQAGTYAPRSDLYAWESAANTVTWERLCTTNTVTQVDDDQATINFTGGFKFKLAGTSYSSVRIMSNGLLQFGTDNGLFRVYPNTNMPVGNVPAISGCTSSGATTNTLMPYWTDLNPAKGGTVTWEQKGSAPNRYFVASWTNVPQFGLTTPYTFQIILYENGEFKYQYGNANTTGTNATIGVQLSNTNYTLFSYQSSNNAAGTAIRWYIPSTLPTRVADYRFDELSWSGTNGEVFDSSGNYNNGVRLGNAANTASGYICRALSVPSNTTSTIAGVDSNVQVTSVLGAKGSLSLWYAGNGSWASTTGMLMDATTATNRPFHLSIQSGVLRLVVSDNIGNTLTANSPVQNVAANSWVHVAATWSLSTVATQSTLKLYINGALVTTAIGTTNGLLDPGIGAWMIGDNRSTVTPAGGTLNSANGRIDEVRLYNHDITVAQVLIDQTQSHGCTPTLDHLEIRHASGTGLTCTPSTLTIAACADASCSTPYTLGVTATLSSSASVVWADTATVTIPSGSSTIDRRVQRTTAGTTLLGATASAPTASNATTCNFGSPACTYTASASGLLLSAPNHIAESSGNLLTVRAVRSSDNSNQCLPAFTGTKSIRLQYAYQNPATGTAPVRIGGAALGPSGSDTALTFDATGTATAALAYADVGQVQLTGTYTGSAASNDTGLVMTGSTSFISAPASFTFAPEPNPTGTRPAGKPFTVTLEARNKLKELSPNFGKESSPQRSTLSHTKKSPTWPGSSSGEFNYKFENNSTTIFKLTWSEVGSIDLHAELTDYLSTGIAVTGSTGTALGRFIPDRFDVDVSTTPGCDNFSYAGQFNDAGQLSYAGQPFTVKVTAKNRLNGITVNYDGGSATLSDAAAPGPGSFGSTTVASSTFNKGVSSTQLTYNYLNKITAPHKLTLRATDTDKVTGDALKSLEVRSGRLWLSNVFGSEKAALQLPVQAQYWTGKTWALNSADSCTKVKAESVVPSGYLSHQGSATTAWTTTPGALTILGGNGTISLSAPSPTGSTGSVDLALNLGSTTTDASCLSSHPASTGAGLPWLRGRNGSCASTWDRDPAARASFGVASPETRKTVHVRELY